MAQWLNVEFVPVVDTIELLDLQADGMHWNSYGHLKVANRLKELF
jgi:hypothetical protein